MRAWIYVRARALWASKSLQTGWPRRPGGTSLQLLRTSVQPVPASAKFDSAVFFGLPALTVLGLVTPCFIELGGNIRTLDVCVLAWIVL
jgi:hypothetical protein